MKEFDLIGKIKSLTLPSNKSDNINIGDDCAVLKDLSLDKDILVTSDALVENIHFNLKYYSYYDVGYKSAQVNISDIICKGADPKSMFISLSVPSKVTDDNMMMFYRGLLDACNPYNIEIAGGDTTSSKDSFFISITLVGVVNKNRAILRSTAQVGDNIYVLGIVGESDMGLKKLFAGDYNLNDERIKTHLRPKLFIKEWKEILSKNTVNASIDVSDGLLQDALHIAEESNVEIEIFESSNWALVNRFYKEEDEEVLKSILTGGEDYAILFTTPKRLEETKNLIRIGKVLNAYNTVNRVLFVDKKGQKINFDFLGYQHT